MEFGELGSGWFGMSDITAGSDNAVLPDVSYGGYDMQAETSAGNGFGEFLTGALDKAVNYAIDRDKAQWAMTNQAQQAPVSQYPNRYPQQQLIQSGGNNQLLLLGLGAVVLYLVLK